MTTTPHAFATGVAGPARATPVNTPPVGAPHNDGLFCYAVAFFTVLASDGRQWLGDMAAHTRVVHA
jgi:hypothetical protein